MMPSLRRRTAVFALAAAKHPDSPNAHDSLAQAYRVVGDIPASIREYRRVLELAPGDEAASKHLAELSRD